LQPIWLPSSATSSIHISPGEPIVKRSKPMRSRLSVGSTHVTATGSSVPSS
jgi:hypothetical protein